MSINRTLFLDKEVAYMAKHEDFTVMNGNQSNSARNEVIKCFKSKLISVDILSPFELFSGFDTIKAVTFSYNIGFINKLMEHFKYGEIILGGNYLVQKDVKLQELLSEICTNAYEAGKAICKYEKLVDMLSHQEIEFRTPTFVLDHRKIFLLKSDDGRTRVIRTSANMSGRAWNNDQIEHYEYDDSIECYETYEKDFETAWQLSHEITMDVISSKKAEDLLEGNTLLKSVKETGKTIVLQELDQNISLTNIQYTIDHEKIKEQYKTVLSGINSKAKDGLFEIVPKTLEKIAFNQKKLQQKKYKIQQVTEHYPCFDLDIDEEKVSLNGMLLDLHPSEQEVRSDIDELLRIFNNFNAFVTEDKWNLKRTHFKLMNAVFCSPFHAPFRCIAKIKGIPTSSLPLFALVSSETSNSGKTFMLKVALKMMTGKIINEVKACDYNKDMIRTTQIGVKSVPFFVDEVDNAYISRIKDIIKNPEACENQQITNMPMLIFASNDVLKPIEPLRKRMIFFTIDGALSSDTDKTAMESIGISIIKKLGTGFYREYLSRMLKAAKKEYDFIIHSKNIPDEYYPDLMKLSSEIFLNILTDYEYSIPDYMDTLSWSKDYSSDSNADAAIREVIQFCREHKRAYKIDKTKVIIEMGTDKASQKQIESWKNILPAEMKATMQTTRECSTIAIDRKELEKHLGYKLNTFSFLRRK